MNKAFLIGRLTQDPEMRTTPNGVSVCTLRLAVNRRFKREETDYFTVIAWRGLADNCGKYLVKGQQIAVEGEIQTRSYEGKDGIKRTAVEIQADNIEFLAKAGAAGGGSHAPQQSHSPASSESDMFASEMTGILMDDEDLPF